MNRSVIILLCALSFVPCHCLFAQDRGPEARVLDNLFKAPSGVTPTADQAEKLAILRKKHGSQLAPKLIEFQKRQTSIHTEEQLDARRRASREARDAGKTGQALREAVNAAVKLTEKQEEELADLGHERQQLLTPVQREIRAVFRSRQDRQPRIQPTEANVKYGPHERNVLDFWQAKSSEPTPILVSIHGGGFRGGNKSVSAGLLRQCLDAGISVVAITYRLSQDAIAPAQFHDSARAIQFIRHQAEKWKLDPRRIAATGGSAGAGISLWLGFHDDLADPDNEDPVLRQSTRLTCMSVSGGQTSYDPRFIRKLFPGTDTYQHSALVQLFDVDLKKLDELPEAKYRLFEEVSPLHHLTRDDVPAMLTYGRPLNAEVTSQAIGIHHARFGKVLKEKMDALGIPCEVYADGESIGGGETRSIIDFVKEHLEIK